MRGDAIWSLVILERQRDSIRVITFEQSFIQSNLAARATIKNVFRELVKGLEYMHFHSLTNSILPLDVRHGTAADGEVLGDHTEVIIPTLVVAHSLTL